MKLKKKSKLTKTQMEVMHEETNENVKAIREGLQAFEKKFDRKIDHLEQRLENKIDNLETEMKSNFKTVFDQMSNFDDELAEVKSDVKELKEVTPVRPR